MFAAAAFGFFAGGAGVVTPLAGGYAYDFYASGFAQAGWRFNADGTIDRNAGGYINDWARWYEPPQAGVGASYWARATLVSGSTPGGSALNTWIALSGGPLWSAVAVPNVTLESVLLIEIASSADIADLVTSGTYTLIADADLL